VRPPRWTSPAVEEETLSRLQGEEGVERGGGSGRASQRASVCARARATPAPTSVRRRRLTTPARTRGLDRSVRGGVLAGMNPRALSSESMPAPAGAEEPWRRTLLERGEG